jgi:hypothetical protein
MYTRIYIYVKLAMDNINLDRIMYNVGAVHFDTQVSLKMHQHHHDGSLSCIIHRSARFSIIDINDHGSHFIFSQWHCIILYNDQV